MFAFQMVFFVVAIIQLQRDVAHFEQIIVVVCTAINDVSDIVGHFQNMCKTYLGTRLTFLFLDKILMFKYLTFCLILQI